MRNILTVITGYLLFITTTNRVFEDYLVHSGSKPAVMINLLATAVLGGFMGIALASLARSEEKKTRSKVIEFHIHG